MLFSHKMVKSVPPYIVVVHDCQVIDAELEPEVFDSVCNLVIEASFSPERQVPKSICWHLVGSVAAQYTRRDPAIQRAAGA
jgi:hypothetical protein